jgi:hypothetical protein
MGILIGRQFMKGLWIVIDCLQFISYHMWVVFDLLVQWDETRDRS